MNRKLIKDESGQVLVELSLVLVTIFVLIFGIIDFGRAIYDVQVMKNLVGEGSSMASRGTSPLVTAQTVASDAGSDLNISSNGCVIVTIVTNQSGTLAITQQASDCGIVASSKIGCLQGVGGCQSSAPSLPGTASTALSAEVSGSSLSVTEIYYNFSTITPAPALLGSSSLPSQFYAVAYY
jgi:Flp pilus assembly protein TadG